MSCLVIQDLLTEYLLGDLNTVEHDVVASHLASGCSACNAELRLLSESVEVMWQAVPHTNLSEALQKEIVSRACSKVPVQQNVLTDTQTPATTGRWQLIRNPVAQAILAFAAGILFMMSFNYATSDDSVAIAKQRTAPRVVSGSGRNSSQMASNTTAYNKGLESAQLVSLRRQTGSNELSGHVLWDSITREIHVSCYGLPQPPAGTQYSLWLIGPLSVARVVERLEVDANGICKAVAHWPHGDFQYATVTLERSFSIDSKPSDNIALTSSSIQPLAN